MKLNFIKSDFSETWLEEGIVIQVLNKNIQQVDLSIAKQLIEDRKVAAAGEDRPVLVEVGNAVNANRETRKYYSSGESYANIVALAMVMDNFVAKTVASLVFKLFPNPVPIEFFNNKERAVKWLQKYK